MGFATSQGRDREEHERRVPALLEPVLLPAADDEDVPRLQGDPFVARDEDAAARGHVDLVLPVVAVDARAPALLDPDLMEGGLLRAVLLPNELLHQDAVGADLPEPHGLQRPDVRPVHPRRESRSPDKRFASLLIDSPNGPRHREQQRRIWRLGRTPYASRPTPCVVATILEIARTIPAKACRTHGSGPHQRSAVLPRLSRFPSTNHSRSKQD